MARSIASSRELRAAALESERNQQENEARSQSIEAQIATLRAQQEAADNDARKHRMEKEARQQAAREQSFHEISLKAQEALRTGLADEVYTRVAQVLENPEIWQSLKDVTQGHLDTSRTDQLKVLLWEAIAGHDNRFIMDAAAKIIGRKDELISDADVQAIHSSNVCLLPLEEKDILAEKKSYTDVSEIEDSTITNGPFEHETRSTIRGTKPQHRSTSAAVAVAVATQHSDIVQSTIETDPYNEDEPMTTKSSISYKPMTKLEEEEASTITAESSIIHNDREATSPLFSPISPRSDLNPDFDATSPRTTTLEKSITPKKRTSKDKSNSSNKNTSPRATKKAKISKDGDSSSECVFDMIKDNKLTSIGQRIAAFVENSKAIGVDGLAVIDFRCTECGKLVEKDARITTCLHLYDNSCLKSIRAGSTGKQAHKIKCHRAGCEEEIGAVHILATKALQDLKKTYGRALKIGSVGTGDLTDDDDDA